MSRKYLYLALFVIGTVVPYLSFVPWVMDHGLDISQPGRGAVRQSHQRLLRRST